MVYYVKKDIECVMWSSIYGVLCEVVYMVYYVQ